MQFRTLAEEQDTDRALGADVDDAQRQYFERGRMQGIFEGSNVEVAEAADLKEVSGLEEVAKRAKEVAVPVEEEEVRDGSIILEEGDATIEANMKRDAAPLSQLLKLQAAYAFNRPSRVFQGRHKDKLKRFVTPNAFEGELVFHGEGAYVLQQEYDAAKSQAHVVIKQIPILQLLDAGLKGDTFQENYPAKQVAKVTTFDNGAAAKELGRLSPAAQDTFAEAFQLRLVKRDFQWLQNGKHLYLWSLTRKGNVPFGSSLFRLVEIDLETGKDAVVPGFDIEEQDGEGERTALFLGFAKRETDRRYPFPGAKAVVQTKFVSDLKNAVVILKKCVLEKAGNDFVIDPRGVKITARWLARSKQDLVTIHEGAYADKQQQVVGLGAEDALYLQEPGLHIQQKPKYSAFADGLLFLHEDAYAHKYFKIYRITRSEDGAVTSCELEETLPINSHKVQGLNDTVSNQNYKFLYDDNVEQFFFQRAPPIEPGAFIVVDGIMNKIIQIVDKQDSYRMQMCALANHGNSFQRLSCKKLVELASFFPAFKEQCSTLSYALAYKFAELSLKRNQQVIVSRQFSNMARCEDTIFYWHNADLNKCKAYADEELKVDSLGLRHCDYFLNGNIRNEIQSQRGEQSYISQINHTSWQTSLQRRQAAEAPAPDVNYTRLFSWDGQMLLARVKNQHIRGERPSFMERLMAQHEAVYKEDLQQEDRLELFKFHLAGSTPDNREEAVIKYDQDWRLFYERLRFEDDDRFQRPLVFGHVIRDDNDNVTGQQFWLCLYDFKKEQIVRQVGINLPELNVSYQIENVSVAACSEVKQNKNNSSAFNQKYLVAFPLKHQLRVKIVEYTITWDYSRGTASVTIQQTAIKEFVQRCTQGGDGALFAPTEGLEEIKLSDARSFVKPRDENNVQVLPFLDGTNKICGTQIVIGTGQNTQLFVLEKSEERSSNRMSKIPLVKNQGYKIFKDESTHEYAAIVAFTQLTKAAQQDVCLNDQDRVEILEDSVRAVLNSVVFDPTLPLPAEIKDRNYNEKFLKYIDIGRGVELFDWFSVASLKSNSPDLDDLLEQSRRPPEFELERFQQRRQLPFVSLLERVLVHEIVYQENFAHQVSTINGQTVDYDRLKTLRRGKTLLHGHEILQRDIFFNHPLHYLFDIEEEEKSPKDKFVGSMLDFIFSKDNNGEAPLHYEAQKHLMGMIVDLVGRPETQEAYFANFISQKNRDYNLNMCRKISYDGVPETQDRELQAFPYQQPEHMLRMDPSDVAKRTIGKHRLASGHAHAVDCLMFDMRQHNFEQKIKYIKKNVNQEGKLNFEYYDQKKPQFTWSAHDMCSLVASILAKTPGEIQDQRLLRHITDHQYRTKTRRNSLRMLLLYCFGFFIPFFLQLFWFKPDVVITCNVMCLLTSLFLFRFEIEQMKIQGDAYFESFFNWVDMFGFVAYLTYFCLRMIDPELQMPDFKQDPIEDILTLLSFPIILYTAMKLLFYFQMFEGFGLFMHLITETFKDITVFLPFMFFWIFVFSCQMYSLGGAYGAGDYPELHEFLIIVLATWRNAIGDIYAPDYSKWSANLSIEEQDQEDTEGVGTTYSYTMITLVWLVWFLNQLFLFLVLTNFLISIIGNSFGNNIDKQEEVAYNNKIGLNVEAALYKKWWGNDKKFDTIVILAAQEEEAAPELDSDALLGKLVTQMAAQKKQIVDLKDNLSKA